MEDHQKQGFADTQPEPTKSGAPSDAGTDQVQATAADFDAATRPGDLWPEAADALCSEHAALFAGTQPAPLSVV
jgi:hypothetical protein